MPYGYGFTPPREEEITMPQPRASQGQMQNPNAAALIEQRRRRQMMMRKQALNGARMGEYQAPRQSLGGPHMTSAQQQEAHPYAGYSPALAGTYGGRPPGITQVPQTQMQALTRQPWTARTMNRRPFGGTAAVTRNY